MKVQKLYRLPSCFVSESMEFAAKHSVGEDEMIAFLLDNINNFISNYRVVYGSDSAGNKCIKYEHKSLVEPHE